MLLYPHSGIQPATGTFGLLGLWGFARYLFYPKGKMSEILDEREMGIIRQAKATAFGVFWVFFIGSSMITWSLHSDGNITVPAYILPLIVLSAGILVVFVLSVTMLVLSRIGIKHAE
jgi:hypothetical protein